MKRIALLVFAAALIASMFTSLDFTFAAMSAEDVAKKKEGWYPTGLPLVNFSSDTGLGYGVRLYLYNNGAKTDQAFSEVPYLLQTYIQYFATTGGWQYHEFNVDKMRIFGSNFRAKTSFVFEKKLNANYFGQGAATTERPLTDLTGTTNEEYDKYEDYKKEVLEANNYTRYKFNNYTITAPKFSLDLYYYLGQYFKFLLGYQVRRIDIDPWDDRDFELGLIGGDSYRHVGDTLLSRERPTGYEGGWTNFARIGLALDTRDFEPDPNNGVYIDYAFEISDNSLGSEYDYVRSTVGFRGYVSPFRDFVVAVRAAYTDTSGEVPFYEKSYFAFLLNRYNGLGGYRTLRGYMEDRFVANTMTMGNAEFRYRITEITGGGQRFAFKVVGFYDIGNAYDNAKDPYDEPRWGDYKSAYGGGLVIAWNMNTIIHFYYGVSAEESAISINFMHSIE